MAVGILPRRQKIRDLGFAGFVHAPGWYHVPPGLCLFPTAPPQAPTAPESGGWHLRISQDMGNLSKMKKNEFSRQNANRANRRFLGL